MVKDHSDSERGHLLPPVQELLFPNSSKGSFIMHHPTDRMTHTTTFVTLVVDTGWNENYLNGSTMKDRSDDPSHHEQT